MSKTTNKVSTEVQVCAVPVVFEPEHEPTSRWAAIVSVAQKIGGTAQTLDE